MRPFAAQIRAGAGVARIERVAGKAIVIDGRGEREAFDHVVVATHANEALALLADASADERALLGAFRYSRNDAILHTDEGMMPRRRAVWSSWNAIGAADGGPERAGVTYWMNRLQNLPTTTNVFVTLNPTRALREGSVQRIESYEHPLFDAAAIAAQTAAVGSCRARATPGFAAPISVRDFTRTGCRRDWRRPSNWAAFAAPGASPTNPRASSCPRRARCERNWEAAA